jgi:hypothetical protein
MRPIETRLKIQIPLTLAEELQEAARTAATTPEQYAREIIEAFCAERRMKQIDADKMKRKDSRPRMNVSGGDSHPPPKGVFVMDMTKAESEEFLKAIST